MGNVWILKKILSIFHQVSFFLCDRLKFFTLESPNTIRTLNQCARMCVSCEGANSFLLLVVRAAKRYSSSSGESRIAVMTWRTESKSACERARTYALWPRLFSPRVQVFLLLQPKNAVRTLPLSESIREINLYGRRKK